MAGIRVECVSTVSWGPCLVCVRCLYGGCIVLQLLFSVVAVYLECVEFVQARGGCLCAGPYGAQLLGISRDQSKALEVLLLDSNEGIVR